MKEPLHIRVFELQTDKYQLPYGGPTFEEYVLVELQEGYVIMEMANFTIEKLRVITRYAPTDAKKYLDAAEGIIPVLADALAEEV